MCIVYIRGSQFWMHIQITLGASGMLKGKRYTEEKLIRMLGIGS